MTTIYGKNDSEELIKRGGMNKPPFVNPMNEDYNFCHRAKGQTPMGEHGKSAREKHADGDIVQDGSMQNQPYPGPMQRNVVQPYQNPSKGYYPQLMQGQPSPQPMQPQSPYAPAQPQNPYDKQAGRQPYAAGGVAKLRLGYPDTIGQPKEGHINKNVD